MKIEKTKIEGVNIIEPDVFTDDRGYFIKPFNKEVFKQNGWAENFAENFYSISNKNVIRGMHFQTPPQAHAKLVYVPNGAILDVILDLRMGSPTYGQHVSIELSAENRKMVYIPVGCAHGFLSLRDYSCTMYLQETVRSAEHEGGIKIDSFGMDWGVPDPIISKRDQEFGELKDFRSPFNYSL